MLSQEADTTRRPFGLTATPETISEWPASVRSSRPLSRSHTFSRQTPHGGRPNLPPPQRLGQSGRLACAVRGPFLDPTPSACGPEKQTPHAGRPGSPPPHELG